ncbi:MAG: proteasome subunit beta [Actinomycetota bacterium]|nr:proteasome subunit beta [Actinomycetota bacterium]MEC8985012.1 proteasome subunit beta [Actinomycetota bacterium]MED5229531.1 proteasome subunit beta [Actinomycetota bacterium]MED5446519.1 proteasome subunit beta [Actinomycetota bacterium]
MTLPRFTPEQDPGPNFLALVDDVGIENTLRSSLIDDLPHGTTCVAIKYDSGVILAGDRRATSGHQISHRTMEKVFPADQYSGIAIAGAAGPALEMVRLFQLQLEHYEKVEGKLLSLDGKANQLSQMIRQNLPQAMQGLAVIPLFAGFDVRLSTGRLFQFDVTGGRYEEANFAATGSGSVHATTVIKMGYEEQLNESAAVDLAANAIFEAADEDSATGGPDLIRDVFPIIAKITSEGYEPIPSADISSVFTAIIDNRRSRALGGE